MCVCVFASVCTSVCVCVCVCIHVYELIKRNRRVQRSSKNGLELDLQELSVT